MSRPSNNHERLKSAPIGDRTAITSPVVRFTGTHPQTTTDDLAVEEPLEIRLMHGPENARAVKSISVTMRTPGNDFELAAGFLMTEGVIQDSTDIAEISYTVGPPQHEESETPGPGDEEGRILPYQPERNVVQVELHPDVRMSMANLERNFYTTSSCGICGKASLLALRTVCPPRTRSDLKVAADLLYSLPSRLRFAQGVFDKTGGLHASGLFDASGRLLSIREDVGRHNAVDKLLGAEFLADRVPLRDYLLFLSGRASFELLQKALMGGIPMVVSVGAPSSLAVQVAREFGITLIGFLRADHFNVYHGAERLLSSGSHPAEANEAAHPG